MCLVLALDLSACRSVYVTGVRMDSRSVYVRNGQFRVKVIVK